jgi:hypothetical protein
MRMPHGWSRPRASDLANTQTEIDVATFTQWVDAYARHQTQPADFYRKRFRREFQPAVAAWVATHPLKNANAPVTPFAMPNYRLAATAQAGRLQVAAEAAAADASRDIRHANDYVLAVALFFGGISTRLQRHRPRAVLLGLGCALLAGTLAWVATFALSMTLLVVMTAGTVLGVVVLAYEILVAAEGVTATILLGRGAAIWVANVIIFSLWYWQVDRGGPAERAAGSPIPPSFAFPENATPELAPAGWRPTYPDYLYLAYTNATAFSPTDTLPVRRWAKLTMMVQSTLSLVIAILVVARAINVLPG